MEEVRSALQLPCPIEQLIYRAVDVKLSAMDAIEFGAIVGASVFVTVFVVVRASRWRIERIERKAQDIATALHELQDEIRCPKRSK